MLKLEPTILRRLLRSPYSPAVTGVARHFIVSSPYTTDADALPKNDENGGENERGKWLTLPPFAQTVNGYALGKELAARGSAAKSSTDAETTALKWILRCCPDLPRNLVQKLFRLRQVRKESSTVEVSENVTEIQKRQLKRVAAKESLNIGDRIYLPISVKELPAKKQDCHCNDKEVDFIRSLVLYKDSSIIVINKPPGMPVQGGIGIRRSLDELAATCLNFDQSERPRLVHRLDRDCSGLLVLGRTQTSATVLHSIFREKTFDASKNDIDKDNRILQRKYWALVIGTPRQRRGVISVPLGKVVVDNGKSDRITVFHNAQAVSSQHAVTEYRVIKPSSDGYTWLELSPLTGRKHQLRVHCAEVLGTPIVGDYKYGWQAHKKWNSMQLPDSRSNPDQKFQMDKQLPFGLDLESGSINGKLPYLHLHCKEMILPNVSQALEKVQLSSDYNFSELETLKFNAPLPLHMQTSWGMLDS